MRDTAAFAALLTLLLRLVYAGFAALLVPHLRLDPAVIGSNRLTEHILQRSAGLPYTLLGVWERFDTLWYLHIAAYGYDRPDAVVFYPLYPLLIRIGSALAPPLAAALVISTVACFFLFWGLEKLLRFDLPHKTARRAVWLLAAWPGSFMLLAGYPDSLVLALTVWSICIARQGRWRLAAGLAFGAVCTKAVGALALVPLVLLAWRKRDRRAAAPLLVALLSPLAYHAFLKLGGYGASAAYARYWSTSVEWPWTTLVAAVHAAFTRGHPMLSLNLGMLVLITTLALLKRVRPEYTWYTLAAVVLFLTKRTEPLLQSTMRYVLALFPGYAALAGILRTPWQLVAVMFLSFGLNLLLLRGFFEWSLVV